MNDRTFRRVSMCIGGVVVSGISVGFLRVAACGIDPFQALVNGLNAVFPIRFGTLYVLINLVLLLFAFAVDRRYIGVATFVNLFLFGYIVEFTQAFMLMIMPSMSLVTRIVMLGLGIVLLCLGSAFYFVADLGVSTYDAIALILANNWKVMPFRYARILTDLCCITIGVVLLFLNGTTYTTVTEMIGIGTIITAFFMGPLVDYFINRIATPFLEGNSFTEGIH